MSAPLSLVKSDPARTLTVPGTIDDLRGVADAFLSTGWTLAAAVWAWTFDTGGGRPRKGESPHKYTLSGFADLRVRGLSNPRTVTRYRAIWQSAIDAGLATSVEPGDVIEEPDAPFGLIADGDPQPTPGPTPHPDTQPDTDQEVWDDGQDESPYKEKNPLEVMFNLTNRIMKDIQRVTQFSLENELTAEARTEFKRIRQAADFALKDVKG